MNWKLRIKNKTILLALIGAIVAFVYQLCGILEVVPPISESDVINVIGIIVNLLVTMGVLVDPTTPGIKDSARAMDYEELGGSNYAKRY